MVNTSNERPDSGFEFDMPPLKPKKYSQCYNLDVSIIVSNLFSCLAHSTKALFSRDILVQIL